MAWLTEAQALLAAKERDTIPDDLTVVDTLVKEHLEFHEELAQKNKDADRLTKIPVTDREKKKSLSGRYVLMYKLLHTFSLNIFTA